MATSSTRRVLISRIFTVWASIGSPQRSFVACWGTGPTWGAHLGRFQALPQDAHLHRFAASRGDRVVARLLGKDLPARLFDPGPGPRGRFRISVHDGIHLDVSLTQEFPWVGLQHDQDVNGDRQLAEIRSSKEACA